MSMKTEQNKVLLLKKTVYVELHGFLEDFQRKCDSVMSMMTELFMPPINGTLLIGQSDRTGEKKYFTNMWIWGFFFVSWFVPWYERIHNGCNSEKQKSIQKLCKQVGFHWKGLEVKTQRWVKSSSHKGLGWIFNFSSPAKILNSPIFKVNQKPFDFLMSFIYK